MSEEKPRIIIRRRKHGQEKFHSSAWKIALADFMTTMMALFLVLWVIATATPQQLRGLADYFNTPLAKAMVGGDRDTSSDSVIPGGGPDPIFREGERANAHLRPVSRPDEQRRRLTHLRSEIRHAINSDENLKQIRNQLRFEMTSQGLRIIMVDSEQRPMFELGSDRLEPYMRDLLDAVAPLLNELPNELSIDGYTDSRQYHNGEKGYSNWELSTARANASRRELVAGGLDGEKLLTVTGVADRIPLPGTQPDDPANRRIEVMVLTTQAAQKIRNQTRVAGRSLANAANEKADPVGKAPGGAVQQPVGMAAAVKGQK